MARSWRNAHLCGRYLPGPRASTRHSITSPPSRRISAIAFCSARHCHQYHPGTQAAASESAPSNRPNRHAHRLKASRGGFRANVWGSAIANLTVYPQTGQLFNFSTDQTKTTTFGCAVWKDPGGPDHGPDRIYPPGLQTTGNTTAEHRTHVPAGTAEVVTEDDFTAPGSYAVNTLICISPNNNSKGKPGTWTAKHGFTGSCTAASEAAGTAFIPSNNNPLAD